MQVTQRSKHNNYYSLHFPVPHPTIAISTPSLPVFAGSILTLDCNIYLSAEVGRDVVIAAIWKRNGTVLVDTASQMVSDIAETNTSYLSQLMFTPLQLGLDDGVYNCEARIDSQFEFVLGSMAQSNHVSLHVGGMNYY